MGGNSAGASLTYNAKNQTTAMTYGGQTLSPLTYADVDQTERTQAGSTTFASSPLEVQIAKNGTNSTFYTRDNKGNLIGERTPDGNRWYYLEDGLGSVVAVITDAGSVGNRYGYDPYGKPTTSTGTVANPWGYVGGYLDPTGLVKFGARFYDPNIRRWTQADSIAGSIASPGAINRFAYVNDCPSNFADPSGYFWSWGQIGKFAGLTLGGCVFTVAVLFRFVGGPGAIVYVAIAEAIPGVDVSADVVFAVVAVTACISGAISPMYSAVLIDPHEKVTACLMRVGG